MGYSNNKWRKILYILMIINLCFILFAKFTKVFGYSSDSLTPVTINNIDFEMDLNYITSQYNYYFLYNTEKYIYLFCSNDEMVVNISGSNFLVNYSPSGVLINSDISIDYYYARSSVGLGSSVATWNSTVFNKSLGTHTFVNNSNTQAIQHINIGAFSGSTGPFILSNYNIKNSSNEVIFDNNVTKYPEIANTQQQLETLDFDVLSINAWDYSNEDFDVLFYDLNYGSDTTTSLYPVNVITLNKETLYYNSTLTADPDKNAIYWIPIEEMGFNWVKGNKYGIKFAVRDYGIQGGGGFRGEDYIYNYIGEELEFTVSNTVPDSVITALNNSTQNNIQNNQHEEIVNNMNNITNNLDNVNDALTNTTPDNSVSSDIDSALNFNNQNAGLNNLNNGFFSRLTSMLSNLLGYNLGEDSSVSIPLPHSNKSIVLHSNIIYDNVTGGLRLIINAFWVYIFSFYMWRFINKIYIAISTGNILDTFSSSGEAITNDML